jgi:hypothetical protein
MLSRLFCTIAALLVAANFGAAEEPKAKADAGPLKLKLVSKKDAYTFEAFDKTPAEFKKLLEETAAAIKKQKPVTAPPPPVVDLALQIHNTGKKDVTIQVEGDANSFTLDLKGPGSFTLTPLLGFTADFRLGKSITIEPGKSYEFSIKKLADGFRGSSRYVYWTEPGDYTITASYQMSDADGGKGPLLKAEPLKIKVEAKK